MREEDGGEVLRALTPLTMRSKLQNKVHLNFSQSLSCCFPEGRKNLPTSDLPGCILAGQSHLISFFGPSSIPHFKGNESITAAIGVF